MENFIFLKQWSKEEWIVVERKVEILLFLN